MGCNNLGGEYRGRAEGNYGNNRFSNGSDTFRHDGGMAMAFVFQSIAFIHPLAMILPGDTV
jgi:hypothetical protein